MATAPSTTPHKVVHFHAIVIDASPELHQALQQLFDQADWDVAFAADNRQALQLALAQPCDLIITGERSSSRDDLELLHHLLPACPHTRLIILAEKANPAAVMASIRARAFSYFSRPISTDRLAEMIRIAMEEPFWDDGIEIVSATPNWVALSVRADLMTANRLL